jgi:hypothetical protein
MVGAVELQVTERDDSGAFRIVVVELDAAVVLDRYGDRKDNVIEQKF